ncbi:hypothetical protein NC651_026010 [Populus alba x Populus x berolinensis]|nr:hypothetical protein NC651_026010 [Populus alba x Populus x berolinensis]
MRSRILLSQPKTFVAEEMIDEQKLLDGLEVPKLVSLVNELRAAGRRGQFQGKSLMGALFLKRSQTYILSKRPMKGHGREMIQFGLPIADAPAETENETGTSKDRRVESIPAMLQEVIDRLVGMQVMTVKPDSCIIDIYNEPHMWPPWFGKPVSVLFLTECELTFGREIETVHHGDYRGSLKLSLVPGSLLVMQGKSSDVAKHAIPMIRKQRMLITFTKSQPKKFSSTDGSRLPSHAVAPSSQWGPSLSRSLNHPRHPVHKHYAAIPTAGVLPVPPIRPQIPPPNGVQPIFGTTTVPFPAPVPIPPVSTGWPTASPRHRSARLPFPIPGTGVFPSSTRFRQCIISTTVVDCLLLK